MGLCFDYRRMSSDRSIMFLCGIDLGAAMTPFNIAPKREMLGRNPELVREMVIFNNKR